MQRATVEYSTAVDQAKPWSREDIETLGERVAAKIGLNPGGDIAALVKTVLGGRLDYQDILGDPSVALTGTIFVHGPNDFDIILPSTTSPQRDRFTIAHELGHYFMHSRQGQTPLVANRGGSDLAEIQANWFAAGMLMPSAEFKREWEGRGQLGELYYSYLADRFGVSVQAARVRAKVLHLATGTP